ncbi:hypothetical protein ACLB2K_026998 [Fragaria x ananassa]
MYFSWTWMFWPWFLAVSVGLYGLYCFRKHLVGEASIFEQLAVVTSVFTWLTLVPPAHFNGFLQGWPYVFFLVYYYFFFFNVSVRKRLYGDYYARPHDPKWDVSPPRWYRLLFSVGVMVGHWLAAFEGPELHRIPGGWSNVGIWGLIVVTLLMQYNSTLYLAKYSEKVVVPTAVVQFGPYRWVRHPIYASTMLLFATYCVALRAPLSLLFVIAVCVLYYDQKAKLEEALMIETFGERYMEYASKVFLGRVVHFQGRLCGLLGNFSLEVVPVEFTSGFNVKFEVSLDIPPTPHVWTQPSDANSNIDVPPHKPGTLDVTPDLSMELERGVPLDEA